MTINLDTDLCYGNYSLTGGASGAIQFGTDNIYLDCHGATLTGTGTYGVYIETENFIEIKNCNILNYSASIYIQSSNNLIQDTNVSGNNSGTGIALYTHPNAINDNNFNRIIVSNREYGIQFQGSGGYSNNSARRNIISNSNFNNNINGIYSDNGGTNYIYLYDNNIENNILTNITGWAIKLGSRSNRPIILPDNNFQNSTNAISLGQNNTITNLDLSDQNIQGIALKLQNGNNTHIENCNFSGTGTGTGIDFQDNATDVNIINNTINNRTQAITYGDYYTDTMTNHTINNNQLQNNNNAINLYGYIGPKTNNFTITNNQLQNNAAWAIILTRAENTTLKYNNFMYNGSQCSIVSALDANGNYWSDHSPCTGNYSFTGGSDNSPSCTIIN